MFRPLDLVAIFLFLGAMAAMGIYFSHRNTSTEEYFLGNRAFPGWAVGISMLGTSISSVTFLAIPAAAYILDYRQAVSNLALPVAAVVLPRESSASVRSRTSSGRPAICAMPPALSATGP